MGKYSLYHCIADKGWQTRRKKPWKKENELEVFFRRKHLEIKTCQQLTNVYKSGGLGTMGISYHGFTSTGNCNSTDFLLKIVFVIFLNNFENDPKIIPESASNPKQSLQSQRPSINPNFLKFGIGKSQMATLMKRML